MRNQTGDHTKRSHKSLNERTDMKFLIGRESHGIRNCSSNNSYQRDLIPQHSFNIILLN